MKKFSKSEIIGLVFIGLILFFIGRFAYQQWRVAEDTAYFSCICSIASEIQENPESREFVSENGKWKILNSEEVSLIMSKVKGYDCGKVDNQDFDLWNNQINIALKKNSEKKNSEKLDIVIWSNGADKISGTVDDIICPFGAEIPK